MCGIQAVIDYSTAKFFRMDADAFFGTLLLTSMRGAHSTGMAGIRHDKLVDIIKVKGDPYNLAEYKEYDQWMNRVPNKFSAMLGHGRFATVGDVTAHNAHPFQRGPITLVHNGKFSNWDEMRKEFKNPQDMKVDSDVVCAMLAVFGEERTFKDMKGAFAMIWYDAKSDTVKAIRNKERPLFLLKRNDRDQYLLASEDSTLEWFKAKYKATGIISEVTPGYLYEFNFKNSEYGRTKIDGLDLGYVSTNYNTGKNHPYVDYEYADLCETQSPGEMWGWPHNAAPAKPTTPVQKREEERKEEIRKGLEKAFAKAPASGVMGTGVVHYSRGSLDLKLGDTIKFKVVDYEERPNPKDKEKIFSILMGEWIGDVPVAVRCQYPGPITEIIDVEEWTGKVHSINPMKEADKYVCNVFVKGIEPNGVKPQTTVSVPQDEDLDDGGGDDSWVTLVTGEKIPVHRFLELAKDGCQHCSSSVVIKDADKCAVVKDMMFCETCTKEGHFPKDS